MKYNHYLENCPKVSEIGLGTWQLGKSSDWESMSEEEAIYLVKKSIDLGVNFFDTAPNYGNGSSEERLGKALQHVDRSKIVVNTKFGHTHKGGLNFEANYIRTSLEGSLKRLQMDYVDSLIIHNPPIDYLDGTQNNHYVIFEQLMKEGKIKAYGASLDTFEEMRLFMETTNGKVIEAFFNILHQDVLKAFQTATKKGVGIIAKIPLDSGWLTGKYNRESTFDDIRTRWSLDDIKTRSLLTEKLETILPVHHNLTHTAISFCLAYKAISTVIPGNKNIAQLIHNLESLQSPVSKNLAAKLESFYESEVKPLNIPW